MRLAQLKTTALHWREEGDPSGPPVVFANSLGTDLRLWDPIMPCMPSGARLIRFDNRGHGLSDVTTGAYEIEMLVEDTAELLDQLGVRNAVFVGLSIGGMIGQGLAAARPDLVSALVLSNSAAKMGTPEMWRDRIAAIEEGGVVSMAEAILERWFTPEFRQSPDIALWRNMLTATPVAGYLGCCHALARADLTGQTATLTLPTLVVAGDQDGASPAELVKATADLISGSSFHVLAPAGHLPCVEQPQAFANLLIQFLQEHSDV